MSGLCEESCNSCQSDCDTCQSFCEAGHQLANEHLSDDGVWPDDLKRDDIIIKKIPRSVLNSTIQYIIDAANYGNTSSNDLLPNDKKVTTTTLLAETRSFIYADKITDILTAIKNINNENAMSTAFLNKIGKDKIIYADDFNNMSTAIRELLFQWHACNMCDSQCDLACDACEGCDESCDVCDFCDDCECDSDCGGCDGGCDSDETVTPTA